MFYLQNDVHFSGGGKKGKENVYHLSTACVMHCK